MTNEPIGDATYSPEDNKLRIYPYDRLPQATWEAMKANGWKWAPKQGTFVAPMWTPKRYDQAVELCGHVGDEIQTVEERSEQRAERFEQYLRNRERDGAAAEQRVETLTGGAEVGANVIVGGNDARKAERTAKRIERSMAEVVDQWDKAEYWTIRIPAVRRHAEYKGSAGLRGRRIKELEKDERKFAKELKNHVALAEAWAADGITSRRAWQLASEGRSGAYDIVSKDREFLAELPAEVIAEAKAKAIEHHTNGSGVRHYTRWLDHTRLRLAYERELLNEQVGHLPTVEDKWPNIAVGGMVKFTRNRGEWVRVLRVNKVAGKVNTLTTEPAARDAQWMKQAKHAVCEIEDYQEPTGADVKAAKAARAGLPICNFDGEGFAHMTKAEYKAATVRGDASIQTSRGSIQYRFRRLYTCPTDERGYGRGIFQQVFLTDAKIVAAPTPEPTPEPQPVREEATEAARVDLFSYAEPVPANTTAKSKAEQYREILKNGGVQTVTAHDLYPTPPEIAARMVEFANIEPGDTVLEPSAGTGNIVDAIHRAETCAGIIAVDVNARLCENIRHTSRTRNHRLCILNDDFLSITPDKMQAAINTREVCRGRDLDAVIMNPPFSNGADIKHIRHALTFLKPGGRLVAICANGPRQRAAFMDEAEHWEDLPAGTFKSAGTMVNTALFVIQK